MIFISTASASYFSKSYSVVSADDLDDLKRKLIDSGHRWVTLISTDRWDDIWTTEREVQVEKLSDNDFEWLNSKDPADSRYLVCYL